MKKQEALLQHLRAAVSAKLQEWQSVRKIEEILEYDLDGADEAVLTLAVGTTRVQDIQPRDFQEFLNQAVIPVGIHDPSQLVAAAKRVVDSWETGDLAEAVHNLDDAIRQQATKQFYVLSTWGNIEPSLAGPFETEDERDAEAGKLHVKDPMSYNGCFRLNCTGLAEVGSYRSGELKELAGLDDETIRFRNFYRCDGKPTPGHKGHKPVEWQDEWSCQCNDRCPICDVEIGPYKSEDLD